jgi:hypothetical protein
MDPITLILTALVAGAAAGAQGTASDAIKDAYRGLKALLQRKFAGKPQAELALTEHETDPETWEKPLKKALTEAGTDKDEEVIKAAQAIMAQVDPERAAMGKYRVDFHGTAQGTVVGDRNTVTQTFSDKPDK